MAPKAQKAETPTPTSTGSALAVVAGDDAALTALAEAGIVDDSGDGMDEFNPNDFRTPLKQFNIKGKQTPDGLKITQDLWHDSIEKTVQTELNFALLEIHKSHLYEVYDKKEERNRIVCSSFDRTTGTLADTGKTRPCKGCPDARWTTVDGKRSRNCSEVWQTACLSTDEGKVFAIRFKRTSLDPIRNYLQAYHYGKRPMAGGKRGNIPLFTYRVTARLEMHKSGNYALPVLTRGPVFPSADLRVLSETAAAVRETLEQRLRSADETAGDEGGDTSFDTDAYDHDAANEAASGERGGKKFVE